MVRNATGIRRVRQNRHKGYNVKADGYHFHDTIPEVHVVGKVSVDKKSGNKKLERVSLTSRSRD